MSCYWHIRELEKSLRVDLTLKNLTLDECAAIKEFLAKLRKEPKQ